MPTSWYQAEIAKQALDFVPRLLIGGSDYTARVATWPTFKRTAAELKFLNPRSSLANEDGGLNYFLSSPLTMAESGEAAPVQYDLGLTHPTSGTEYFPVYTGLLQKVKFQGERVDIYAQDRAQALKDRVVGDDEAPAVWSSTAPSTVIWDIVTSYGGLSSVASTSNPDIDYQAWTDWAAVFSRDNMVIDANFDGQKAKFAIDEVMKMTDSAVYPDGQGRLVFRQFTAAGTYDQTFTLKEEVEAAFLIDEDYVNRQVVYGAYDVSSESWGIVATAQNSTSANSYGLREAVLKSEHVWFPDSSSALNIASRKVTYFVNPTAKPELTVPAMGVLFNIGDTFRVISSFYNIGSESGWRLLDWSFNLGTGHCQLEGSNAAVLEWFRLDIDSLDTTSRFLL